MPLTFLVGLLAPAALRAEPANETGFDRFESTYDLSGVARVHVQNVHGAVHVVSWDKNTLKVSAVKKARGGSADETLRQTEIRVTKRGSTIDIETILPKRSKFFGFIFWGGDRGADVTYDISLPASVALDVETVNGRITAEGRTGNVSLNTVNGSVRVDGQDGPLKVNTVNGSVEAAFVGSLRAADLETVNGSVTVSCSRESSVRYDLQTVNGRIQSEFPGVNVEGKWGPKEARGTINDGRERLSVETVNGEVRLQVAESAPRK